MNISYTKVYVCFFFFFFYFFFQAEDGIRDSVASRGLGDVYKRQLGKYHIKVLNVSIKHEGDEVKMSLHVESRANEDMRRLLCFMPTTLILFLSVSYTHLTLPTILLV